MAQTTDTQQGHAGEHDQDGGRFYVVFVDDVECRLQQAEITGGQIMDLAGIPRDAGLVLIEDDGSQRTVSADEVIELKPGRRFRKAPRFKRG